MTLEFNMFEYKGKPFENGLQVYVYAPSEEEDEKEIRNSIGNVSSQIDVRIGENSAVAQFGANARARIYCVPFNPAVLTKEVLSKARGSLVSWELASDMKRLIPTDDNDREIIRRLVANAIAKKQIQRGWFVEKFGFAYHWSFNLSKELHTESMDVYPGFVFRPYIYENGSCAIMIDPKFKFVSKKNLRDVIEDHLRKKTGAEKIKLLFEGDFVIDACPVVDCPHRKNPSSSCRLKGVGKRIRLAHLDFGKSPSEASIGSLIKYHEKPSVCKARGKIAEVIVDRPPIALVERVGRKGFLEYPIERLREELKLHRLHKWQRLLVMKYIRPPLDRRRSLTDNFITHVDDLSVGRLHQLGLVRSFAQAGSKNRPWENYSCFEEIPLKFGNQTSSYKPFVGLEKGGPYDLSGKDRRNFDSLRIMVCNLSPMLTVENIKRFYNDLANGFARGSRFAGMKRIFKIEIPSFSEDLLLQDISVIKELPQRERPDILVIISRDIGGGKVKHYGRYKQELSRIGMPSQFVLEDNLGPRMTTNRYASYLKNLVLTMYCKVGGIPWVLSRSISHNTCFIGLATIPRRNTMCMSVQIFNSAGLWLGGWTEFVDRDKYTRKLTSLISKAQDVYTKENGRPPNKTVLHKDGEMWSDIEINPLLDAFQSSLVTVSVKKTVLPRMYDCTREDYVVPRGSCVQIDRNKALLATSGFPNPIRGSQRPTVVEIKGDLTNGSTLTHVCEEIFSLSLVGGYRLAVISKPITTHLASKAVELTSKYGITENPLLWRKAWFV